MTDFQQVQSIATRLWSPTSWWHPGGMAWQLACEQDGSGRSIRVWGEAAWGWIYQPNVLMLQADPAVPNLAADVVDWFEAERTGTAPRVEVSDADHHVVAALLAAGYAEIPSEPFGLDQRAAAASKSVDLPAGYVLRTAHDVSVEQRVEVHRSAWNPAALPYAEGHQPDLRPGDGSTFSAEKLWRVQQSWPYAAERDFVIMAPDGTPAACCTVWFDEHTGAAEIEPLGVVPVHRRRGLAQALCRVALDAVSGAGGTEVVIHPRGDAAYPAPRAAYAAAGFRTGDRTRIYGRG